MMMTFGMAFERRFLRRRTRMSVTDARFVRIARYVGVYRVTYPFLPHLSSSARRIALFGRLRALRNARSLFLSSLLCCDIR